MSNTIGGVNEQKHLKYNLYEQILDFYEDAESIKEPVKELRGSIKVSESKWIEEAIEMESCWRNEMEHFLSMLIYSSILQQMKKNMRMVVRSSLKGR